MNWWLPEEIERLKVLWADGLSAGQIAHRMHKSRNSIIGKVFRLGLERRKPTTVRPRPRKPRTRRKPMKQNTENARPLPSGRAEPDRHPAPPVMADPAPLSSEAPPEGRITDIESLTNNHCRAPIGDPGDQSFHFCGRATCDRGSGHYCAEHAARFYVPVARHRHAQKEAARD